jgi:hypothetical protein
MFELVYLADSKSIFTPWHVTLVSLLIRCPNLSQQMVFSMVFTDGEIEVGRLPNVVQKVS